MDSDSRYLFIFTGLLSMQFHPKNVDVRTITDSEAELIVERCSYIAALAEHQLLRNGYLSKE